MIPLRDINPTRTFPLITILIIAANALVFVYELTLPPRRLTVFVADFGTVPYAILHGVALDPSLGIPVYLTIFTSMFIHGGWLHIIGNMLYFWIFGNNIEDRFGHLRFLVIYLFWGVIAGLTQVFVDPASRLPAIGASGAIAGVLGAYLVIFPSARVDVLIPLGFFLTTLRLPALFVIGQWILLQFLSGFAVVGGAPADGGVAYFAHIGGAVAGLATGLLYRALVPQRTYGPYSSGV
jgi:membrane associated rhomboid family serine protease